MEISILDARQKRQQEPLLPEKLDLFDSCGVHLQFADTTLSDSADWRHISHSFRRRKILYSYCRADDAVCVCASKDCKNPELHLKSSTT